MPGRPHVYASATTVDVPESAANTETIVATLPGVTTEFSGQQITFVGFLAITPGTTVTGLTIRIRQENITGTIVGEAQVNQADIVASKLGTFHCFGQDPRADASGATYVVTIQGAGEGTAAVCNASTLLCTVA